MPTLIPPPAVRRTAPPVLTSEARWRWQARRLTLDALTGQVGTLTRASTGTALDASGGTVTWPHSAPRWETRTVSSVVRTGLRMATDDLTWPCLFAPETATVFVDLVQLTAAPASNAGVLYVGNDAASGARLVIRGTGTTFAVDLIVTAGTSTATLGTTVAANDPVLLVVQVEDTGGNQRVRIGGRVAGVDVAFSSYGTSRARDAAWASGAKVRANRVGSAGTQNDMWLADAAWFPGALTLAEVLQRL